jgi:hypothetical protein
LDAAFSSAQAVVVLQTPDDVAHLHESLTFVGDPECSPQMQPRPNVLFEAGMAMGRDEDCTVIVEMGRVRVFSDIHGRHVVRLDNDVKKRQDLATRLETAGCEVRLRGTDWHEAGDLTPPAPPGGGLPLGRKLPSSQASGMPRLEARYIDNGPRKIGHVQIMNHGPGDVFELDVSAPEGGVMRNQENDLPLTRLPPGKSFRVLSSFEQSLGSRRSSHFYVKITGKTADGTVIDVDEFVSRDA